MLENLINCTNPSLTQRLKIFFHFLSEWHIYDEYIYGTYKVYPFLTHICM